MASSVTVDRTVLKTDLERFAGVAKEAARLARTLRDGGALTDRETTFMNALVRGARSMECASNTMLMELKNTA